ncbi:hypothetical protein [Halomicrobium salinisoli]|uniref:hypothetical protein n=1 Tax=Halomicrobium salinisoli TaxID=2878391 RepID=UPI001CEFD873|nr:hypothetical protein [Halomicrobium salinisoli]
MGDTMRVSTVAVATLVIASLGACAVQGVGAQTTGGPTLVIEDGQVGAGEQTTVGVNLTSLPNGLAGFEFALAVEGEGARIAGGSVNERMQLSETNVSDGGRAVRFVGVDLNDEFEAGAGEVQLATVTVQGESRGDVEIGLDQAAFDSDDGGRINPAVEAGTVSVGPASSLQQTAMTTAISVVVFGLLLLAGYGFLQIVR